MTDTQQPLRRKEEPAVSERIHATYWLETGDDPARAAEVIAGEQSSGTFVALPNETPELKARSGARVERLDVLEVVDTPSLPGGMQSGRYRSEERRVGKECRSRWSPYH